MMTSNEMQEKLMMENWNYWIVMGHCCDPKAHWLFPEMASQIAMVLSWEKGE